MNVAVSIRRRLDVEDGGVIDFVEKVGIELPTKTVSILDDRALGNVLTDIRVYERLFGDDTKSLYEILRIFIVGMLACPCVFFSEVGRAYGWI